MAVKRSINDVLSIYDAMRLCSERPDSSPESTVRNILGNHSCVVVNSHNTPTILYFVDLDGSPHVFKVEFGTANTLIREIAWYRNAVYFNLQARLFLGAHVGTYFSFLLLKVFGDTSTVDDIALNGAGSTEIWIPIIDSIEKDTRMYEKTSRSVTSNYVQEWIVRRLDLRVDQALKHGYLRNLITGDSVVLNGDLLRPLRMYLQYLASNEQIVDYIAPSRIGIIYGDLHCGNIVVDKLSSEVIDPRSGDLLPIEYDFGKVIQSVEGCYGSIMARQFSLQMVSAGQYEYSVQKPDGYIGLESRMAKYLGDRRYVQSLYQCATHFIAMLPHHASQARETTALYLSGMMMWARLVEILEQ
ncbi:hypothetical protein ACWEKT_37435 [Nocardia takedensis]